MKSKKKRIEICSSSKWDEYFAKYLLEYIFDGEIYNLNVKDQPDLQNEILDIGIEVTTSVDKNHKEMESLYVNCFNKKSGLKRIKELGGNIQNGVLYHPVRHRTLDNIYSIFERKIKLLNSDKYKTFKHNYIFITTVDIVLASEYKEVDVFLNDIQSKYRIKFEKAFIYIYGDDLLIFDLINHNYNSLGISSSQIYIFGEKANDSVKEEGS